MTNLLLFALLQNAQLIYLDIYQVTRPTLLCHNYYELNFFAKTYFDKGDYAGCYATAMTINCAIVMIGIVEPELSFVSLVILDIISAVEISIITREDIKQVLHPTFTFNLTLVYIEF